MVKNHGWLVGKSPKDQVGLAAHKNGFSMEVILTAYKSGDDSPGNGLPKNLLEMMLSNIMAGQPTPP